MDKEIKERIAAINSGVIPEGYKKTKVGIFPQDWKEEKIGELFYKVMERNNGQFDKTKWISVAKMYYQEPEKVTSNNIDTRTYVMRLGDMAFEGHPNKDFLFGRFVVNDLGDGIISELFPIYRHRKQYVTNYWKYAIQFESIMARIYIRCITISGASSNKINDDEFKKESLFLPPLPEQQKIAEIISTQDKLIELQEKKIEQLKELKKAYLQKMFPQKGSKYPELRFKGFTDPWEQRKLGECVTFLDTMRKPLKESEREKGSYPYYGASGIVDYVSDYIFDEELVLLSEDGANITDRNYPVCFLASGKYWVNNHAHVLKVNVENENNFICNSLERMDFTQYNSGMAMPKLNKDVCHNIPLFCPVYEEQKQIGDFFRNLDSLLTLHQRKSEQEKQKKKALMQLLLTGIVRTK